MKTISLCMICGNEEAIILSCLDSAKGAFDEICLVRAVGNQKADKTEKLAWAWCIDNQKGFRFAEYTNSVLLPHVDDFAAARNLSFQLANCDWLLWLDCDDYLDDINCRRIREAVECEYAGLFCSYRVEKEGGEILRERLIRHGHGHWKHAIHETCEVSGQMAHCPQITVFHREHKHKHLSSATRNSTILRRQLGNLPRHAFYLHADLDMAGEVEDARKYAHIALLTLGKEQTEEHYVIHLNLSELEPDKRETHLLEASRNQPHRREAFAYLCQSALLDGRTSDAVSWFRIMDALPLPAPLPWTHQGLWYGWARNWLRVRCLRASGQIDQADKEHAENLKSDDYAKGVKA